MIGPNFKYKLLALAIAIIIWIYADMSQNHEATRHIPDTTIQLRNLEPGFLASCKPDKINVTLKGDKNNLDKVVNNVDMLTAYVDLAGRTAGKYELPVKISIPGEFGTQIGRKAIPDRVSVLLETKISRLFQINVQMLSEISDDYQFAPPMISSGKAVVSGPARLVNSVHKLVVSLDPGDSASSIEGDFTVMALDRKGQNIQGIDINPMKVHLVMELIEAPITRIAYLVLDVKNQPAYPYMVTGVDLDPQTITISGKPDVISKISTIKTKPVVLSNRTKSFSEQVELVIPRGVKTNDANIIKVSVKIEETEGNNKNKSNQDNAENKND